MNGSFVGAKLSYEGNEWFLDLRNFARGAVLAIDADVLTLRLSRARLPGTDFRVDCVVRVYEDERDWRIAFTWLRLGSGASADLALGDWLGSRKGQGTTVDVPLPAGLTMRFAGRAASVRARRTAQPARFSYAADGAFYLSGSLEISLLDGRIAASRLSLTAGVTDPGISTPSIGSPLTVMRADGGGLGNPAVQSTLTLGTIQSGRRLSLTGAPIDLVIAAADQPRAGTLAARIESKGRLLVGRTTPVALTLDTAQVSLVRGLGHHDHTTLEARLAEEPFAIPVGRDLVTISGDPAHPLRLTLLPADRPPVLIMSARLHRVGVAVRNADAARLNFAPVPLTIRFGSVPPLPDTAAAESASLVFGSAPLLRANLAGSRLHVLRYRDLLNVSFELVGFTLRAGPDRVSVARIKGGTARLIAHFGPQHLAERTYLVEWKAKVGDEPQVPLDPIAPVRASEGSRLAFVIDDATARRDWLSLDGLLNWEGLELAADSRTQQRPVDEVLKNAGVNTNDSRADTTRKLLSKLSPPAPTATALELSYRLILSPDHTAKWHNAVSAETIDGGYALWGARLANDDGGKSLRVLWARGVDPTSPTTTSVPNPPWFDSSEAPIPPNNRRDLMLLGVGDGLPALIRGKPGSGQGAGQVRPFPSQYTKLVGDEPYVGGAFTGSPLHRAEVMLTALGGIFIAEGTWEPPGAGSDFGWSGLDTERWTNRTLLGRDILVEVAEKGFLFPLGHRASFIQQTERRFYPHPETGEPVAYLFKRYFIEVGVPEKAFPAPEQPFDGRLFPDVTKVTLRTRRTPDLHPPDSFIDPQKPDRDSGGAVDVGLDKSKVFWPRTSLKAGSEVSFEWTLNDEPGIIRSALLFVANTAAHDAKAMRRIIAHYVGDGDWDGEASRSFLKRLRTAEFSGGSHRYAPTVDLRAGTPGSKPPPPSPPSAGKTSFQTLRWLLAAGGRLGQEQGATTKLAALKPLLPDNAVVELFGVTNVMEGGDQPPFYPILADAEILPQSISRLTARNSGPTHVGPNFTYVEHGFDTVGNPGELYLDVLNAPPPVDFAKAGGGGGGLAHLDFNLVAFARGIGPVGGQTSLRPLPPTPPLLTRIGAYLGVVAAPPSELGPAPVRAEPAAARAGLFDPKQFFTGKLFGIIPIGEIVEAGLLAAAPKLVESSEFAADTAAQGISQALQKTQALVGIAATAFRKDVLDPIINATAGKIDLALLYPELAQSLTAASDALARAEAAASAGTDPQTFLSAVTGAVNSLEALASRIETIAAHPTPAVVTDLINDLQAVLTAIRTWTANANFSTVLDAIVRFDITSLGTEWQTALGLQPPSVDIPDLIARAGSSLVADQLIRPLSEIISAAQALPAQLKRSLGDALVGVTDKAVAFAESTSLYAQAGQALNAATDHCKTVDAALAQWSFGTCADPAALSASLTAIEGALAGALPESLLGDALIGPHRAALQSLQAIGRAVQSLAAAKRKKDTLGICDAERFITFADALRLRQEALGHAKALAAAIGDLGIAAAKAPDSLRRALTGRLVTATKPLAALLKNISSLDAANRNALDPDRAIDTLRAFFGNQGLNGLESSITDTLQGARGATGPLVANIDAAQTMANAALTTIGLGQAVDTGQLAALARVTADVQRYFTDFDRHLASYLATGSHLAVDARAKLDTWVCAALTASIRLVAGLHRVIQNASGELQTALSNPALSLVAPLLRPLVQRLATAATGLAHDQAALDKILSDLSQPPASAALSTALPELEAVRDRWRASSPPFAVVAGELRSLIQSLANGRLLDLVDLASLPALLREQVAQFIPTAVNLSYGYDTDLSPFPTSEPIFQVEPSTPSPHLSIAMAARFDLLRPEQRSISGKATLAPFQIRLLGGLDLATIHFDAATFTLGEGSPKLDVRVNYVRIGPGLQFIQQLQSYLGGNSPTGPYWEIAFPIVTVGYRFAVDSILVGPMLFQNIALHIAARLPLDGQEARFMFSVASAERPLLITYGPYGGGGYVMFEANGRGITAFEASLEVVATIAIRFGPLNASGRVAAGIRISQSAERGAVITGYIHAVGEGSIACFGVSVNIEVSLTHDNGRMIGSAVYTMGFKVALVTLDFSFTASYAVQGSEPAHGAKSSPLTQSTIAQGKIETLRPSPDRNRWRKVVVAEPVKSERWGAYKKRFNLDLLKDAA